MARSKGSDPSSVRSHVVLVGVGRGGIRPVRFVVSLVAAVAWAIAFAGSAQTAGRQAAIAPTNWPNSPVLHTAKQRVGALQPSFSSNLRGGVAVAGNTLETCPRNLENPAAEPCSGTNNNTEDMRYVNVDPGSGRFNSSTATLRIPAGSTVVRAFLYWGADLSRGVSADVDGDRITGHDAPGGNTPAGQAEIALGFPATPNHD